MQLRSSARAVAVGLTTLFTAASLALIVAAPSSAAPHVVQATYWASPTGSGSTCSQTSPCSLEGARDKVRTVNSDMTGDIVVNLLTGTYTLSSTFELTESPTVHDSGTNGFDVIYQKASGATPIISGGESVTGFTLHDAAKSIYKAPVSTGLDTRQLYVDGVRATRARSGAVSGFATTSTGYTLPSTGTYSTMASWGNHSNIEVLATWSWKHSRYSVASITGTAMTMDAAGWNDGATQSALTPRSIKWIENAYELLDAPGEWYLDRSTDSLYYIPLAGQDVATSEFIVGKTVKLVEAAGTLETPLHNVQFNGLTFSHDSWVEPNSALGYPDFQGGAVYRGSAPEQWWVNNYQTPAGVNFSAVENIVVKNSTFTHMANVALAFGPGSQSNVVDHNTFTDISGNGISVGGITVADHHPTNPASIVKKNVISNNTLTKIGAEYLDNVAIFLGYTQASDVRHNTLHDLPYTGISMGWGWGYIDELGTPVAEKNVVRGNLIYDFMKTVHDGGAIYTLGSQAGSKVLDNYSYGNKQPHGYLYRDNGSAGFYDHNNVISNQDSPVTTWYYTNVGSGGYWNAHNNLAEGNYYSQGMTTKQTGGSNVAQGNTEVAGFAWPAGAQQVIAEAGVDGVDITPVTVGDVPLSRGKTATASSTYATGSYGASKAVDGDPTTRWAQASGAADPSWLTVDLGDEYLISSVNTSAYLHAGKGMKYKIEYSTDNSAYDMYANKTSKFTVPGEDTNPDEIVARYVRITFTGTQAQGGSIFEFDVFGQPLPPISQGKTATASTTYSTSYSPDKAVDGSAASRWAQASGAGDPQWLKVDLGDSYTIDKVVTTAYLPSGAGMKYKIEYSTDDNTYSMYADKTGAFTTPGVDTNPGAITARYVRITLTGTQGQGSSLYEFEVHGDPLPPVSLNKTVTASSVSGTDVAANAVDGINSSRWAASGTSDPSWLLVDLGETLTINRVVTKAYLANGLGVKYKIEHSTDGTNYSMYADKTASYSTSGTDTNAGLITARYVRLTFTDTQSQGGSIREFSVYGGPVMPVLLSQGGAATASSTYSATYDAAKAVDGNTSTRWAQASGSPDPSWLKVDLGAERSITSVSTQAYLPGGLGMKYKIEYSTDNSTWAMYADKTGSFSTPGVDTNPGSVTARYVRITFTGTQGQGGSVYEFKVYGN